MVDHPDAGCTNTACNSRASDPDTTRPIATLCEACSKLNVQHLSFPSLPCRSPLPCSTPPIDGYLSASLAMGSVRDVRARRAKCDLCYLVARDLPAHKDVDDSECRIRESAEFCNFVLPESVHASDPAATHVHLTQVVVILDKPAANQFHGPALPWNVKKRDESVSRDVLILQTKARTWQRPQSGINRTADAKHRQTERAFLDTIGGRPVGTQADTQLIQAWLRACEHTHGTPCMPSLQLPDRSPTFVIDVVASCLVDTPVRCRYVALSYVWGKAVVFKHVLENTRAIRKSGALRALPIPATIRDAITLVRAVGERYLWVDSICIIQDDLKMQQEEIMQMGSIYSRALFTIVAAAGDHANSGLPGVEPGSRKQVQETLKLVNCELLTTIGTRNSRGGIDEAAWAQRAWTFQERILSNKILVFSENQVYWHCRVTSQEEERALEHVEEIDRHDRTFPQTASGIDGLPREPLEFWKYCGYYRDLLGSYWKRQLTYPGDILNAFNGVTEILGAIQNDRFFWGLPESIFSYALAWRLLGYSSRNNIQVPIFESDGTNHSVPIPSWSWAAWSGKESVLELEIMDGYRNVVQPVIRFNIVDTTRRLVAMKEAWQDDRGRASWQDAEPERIPNLSSYSITQIGQLHFWTSIANVKAIRERTLEGRAVRYELFDFRLDTDATIEPTSIVHQDFIVIAAMGRGDKARLVLLAVEWKECVAYRVGKAEVKEVEWIQIGNREWRWITLG